MFLELIATFFAGFAAAGVVLILNKILGGRLPKWFMPVAAGAAMLVATISSEYGWFARNSAKLPEGLEIVQTFETKAKYRPWTYVRPFIGKFRAVDMISIKTNDMQPDLRGADIYTYGRWAKLKKNLVLTDCANGLVAQPNGAVVANDDGTLTGINWITPDVDDPILATICRE